MTKIKGNNGTRLKPSVTAIIQARLDSSRLPAKALADLAGKPLLYHVFERTLSIENIDKVVLATGTGAENLLLVKLAESMEIDVFIGSPDNVLERYYLASEKFGGDYIVRITGDNPLTDPEYAAITIDIAIESHADICSIANLPLGTGVGIIRKQALAEAYHMSSEPYHFEHVTPYIKEHTEIFNIHNHTVAFENPFDHLRLTVDTEEDYRLMKEIYEALYRDRPIPLCAVIDFLKVNPQLVELNRKIKQRPMTQSSMA